MMRSSLRLALALVAIASTAAVAQQAATPKPAKVASTADKDDGKRAESAKDMANDAHKLAAKAEKDSVKALNADLKSKKAALKRAKAAHDTALAAKLQAEIAADKSARKALKANEHATMKPAEMKHSPKPAKGKP